MKLAELGDVLTGEAQVLLGGVTAVLVSPEYQRILAEHHVWDDPWQPLDSIDWTVNPLPPLHHLRGPDDQGLFARIAAAVSALYGYRIELCDEVSHAVPAAGVAPADSRRVPAAALTSARDRRVRIRRGSSPLHLANMAAHEAGHIALHRHMEDPMDSPELLRAVELQAEMFAWLLLRRAGVDSGPFSFSYIAKYGWVRKGAWLFPETGIAQAIRTMPGPVGQMSPALDVRAV